MHRMNPEFDRNRKQDRRHYQDDGRCLHHIAGQQQQYVDDQQKDDPVHPDRGNPLGNMLRDVLIRHQEREQHRIGNDVEDHRAHIRGTKQHLGHVPERHVAINEYGDDKRVHRADRGGFRRGEQARIDPAENDQDQQQAPDAFLERHQALRPACAWKPRIVVLPCSIKSREPEQRRQHDPRDHTGHEHLSNRGRRHASASRIKRDAAAGCDTIDHHHDRRRDQDAECAGGGDHAGTEAPGETLPHHRRQHDRTDGDHGRW